MRHSKAELERWVTAVGNHSRERTAYRELRLEITRNGEWPVPDNAS